MLYRRVGKEGMLYRRVGKVCYTAGWVRYAIPQGG